jgi:prevent-host-death family protein
MIARKKTPKTPKTPKTAAVREATTSPYGVTVSASEFKTHCLELMNRVQQTQEEITVTRYGKPVAKLVPIPGEQQKFVGSMKGTVIWYGDIISPIDVEWEANSDD